MKKLNIILTSMILIFASSLWGMDNRTIIHISTVPVIEGLGIYSSIQSIRNGDDLSKAAGITNISLLACQAGLGAYLLLGKPNDYSRTRKIHKIGAMVLTAAGLWMTIASAVDNNIPKNVRYTAGGYTTLTIGPHLIFNF